MYLRHEPKNTLIYLTVKIVRDGIELNGLLAGLTRREDMTKFRAVELNMVGQASRLSHARQRRLDVNVTRLLP